MTVIKKFNIAWVEEAIKEAGRTSEEQQEQSVVIRECFPEKGDQNQDSVNEQGLYQMKKE